ncbi:MAG: 6-phosphogluconolactonase [Anaerolineales bacterium]|nr:6-phosphogluconolactonase [Anaerolineales bacterium]
MQSNTSIKIFSDLKTLSEAASSAFTQIANEAIQTRGRFFVSLAGGNTPIKLYEKLVRANIDWKRVYFFWGDERCVPVTDAGNCYGQAKQILFDQISETNIQRIPSELEPASAAQAYAATLKSFAVAPLEWPRFDLVLLGMGEDGHTASLFPGSPVEAQTATVAVVANYQDRPANRVSLTPHVFNDAKNIFFLVSGAGKAETLKKVLSATRTPRELPAQRIDPKDGQVVWFADSAAASLLP